MDTTTLLAHVVLPALAPDVPLILSFLLSLLVTGARAALSSAIPDETLRARRRHPLAVLLSRAALGALPVTRDLTAAFRTFVWGPCWSELGPFCPLLSVFLCAAAPTASTAIAASELAAPILYLFARLGAANHAIAVRRPWTCTKADRARRPYRSRRFHRERRHRARRRWCSSLRRRCFSRAETQVMLQRAGVEPNPGPKRDDRDEPATRRDADDDAANPTDDAPDDVLQQSARHRHEASTPDALAKEIDELLRDETEDRVAISCVERQLWPLEVTSALFTCHCAVAVSFLKEQQELLADLFSRFCSELSELAAAEAAAAEAAAAEAAAAEETPAAKPGTLNLAIPDSRNAPRDTVEAKERERRSLAAKYRRDKLAANRRPPPTTEEVNAMMAGLQAELAAGTRSFESARYDLRANSDELDRLRLLSTRPRDDGARDTDVRRQHAPRVDHTADDDDDDAPLVHTATTNGGRSDDLQDALQPGPHDAAPAPEPPAADSAPQQPQPDEDDDRPPPSGIPATAQPPPPPPTRDAAPPPPTPPPATDHRAPPPQPAQQRRATAASGTPPKQTQKPKQQPAPQSASTAPPKPSNPPPMKFIPATPLRPLATPSTPSPPKTTTTHAAAPTHGTLRPPVEEGGCRVRTQFKVEENSIRNLAASFRTFVRGYSGLGPVDRSDAIRKLMYYASGRLRMYEHTRNGRANFRKRLMVNGDRILQDAVAGLDEHVRAAANLAKGLATGPKSSTTMSDRIASSLDLDDRSLRAAAAKASAGFAGEAAALLLRDIEDPSEQVDPVEGMEKAKKLHPRMADADRERFKALVPPAGDSGRIFVDMESARQITSRLARGKAPGCSGMTEDLLKQACTDDEVAGGIGNIIEDIANDLVPDDIRDMLTTARLVLLKKPDNGVRPIAICEAIVKCASSHVIGMVAKLLDEYFAELQYGLRDAGCEQIINFVRNKMFLVPTADPTLCIVTVDFRNAFNSIKRSIIATQIQAHRGLLEPVVSYWRFAYGRASRLRFFHGDTSTDLWSEEGVRQGDPSGPAFFCLGIHPMLQELADRYPTVSIRAYMDDVSLIGPPDDVIKVFNELSARAGEMGLLTNPAKCYAHGCDSARVAEKLGIKHDANGITLLGARLSRDDSELAAHAARKAEHYREFFEKIGHPRLPLETQWRLLQACGPARWTFLSRTHDPDAIFDATRKFDELLLCSFRRIARICEEPISAISQTLIELPARLGGLGLPRYEMIGPLAYEAATNPDGADQKVLTSKYYRGILKELTDRSAIDTAFAAMAKHINACTRKGASAWLRPVTVSGSDLSFGYALQYRIRHHGPPTFTRCDGCDIECEHEQFDAHVLGCTRRHGFNATKRHHAVVRCIAQLCERAGVVTQREVTLAHDLRMDLVVHHPNGKCLMVDATVFSSDNRTHADTSIDVIEHEKSAQKAAKYMEICNDAGAEFHALAIDVNGGLAKWATRAIDRLAFYADRSREYFTSALSHALQIANGEILVQARKHKFRNVRAALYSSAISHTPALNGTAVASPKAPTTNLTAKTLQSWSTKFNQQRTSDVAAAKHAKEEASRSKRAPVTPASRHEFSTPRGLRPFEPRPPKPVSAQHPPADRKTADAKTPRQAAATPTADSTARQPTTRGTPPRADEASPALTPSRTRSGESVPSHTGLSGTVAGINVHSGSLGERSVASTLLLAGASGTTMSGPFASAQLGMTQSTMTANDVYDLRSSPDVDADFDPDDDDANSAVVSAAVRSQLDYDSDQFRDCCEERGVRETPARGNARTDRATPAPPGATTTARGDATTRTASRATPALPGATTTARGDATTSTASRATPALPGATTTARGDATTSAASGGREGERGESHETATHEPEPQPRNMAQRAWNAVASLATRVGASPQRQQSEPGPARPMTQRAAEQRLGRTPPPSRAHDVWSESGEDESEEEDASVRGRVRQMPKTSQPRALPRHAHV